MDIKNKILKTEKIQWKKLKWLQPDNLKDLSKVNYEKLKQSVIKNNFIQPFNVWQKGKEIFILDGHHRQKVLNLLEADGIVIPDLLPANFVQCKDRKEAAKLVLVYSSIYAKTTEEGLYEFLNIEGIDFEELKNEIDLPEIDLKKFDEGYLSDEVQEDDYEMPETIETDIVIGDLFEIGEHRLLCGDSTDSDAVEKLLQGKEPYLMVTDPPYGVEYDADWRNKAARTCEGMGNRKIGAGAIGKVKNDDNADWTPTWALSPSKVAYVWHAGKYASVVDKSLTDNDYIIRSQIIWVKSNFAISRGDYHWKHEPCWYAVKKGNAGNWAGDRKQTTVWEINKQQSNETGHSTQKPVECMSRPIQNHDGDVYDPFLGSGTTMVASHQLKRKCYGMELDPKYCQVIIDRMIKLDDKLVIKKNGKIWHARKKK